MTRTTPHFQEATPASAGLRRASLALVCLGLGGCGAGTAAVASGTGGGSGSNAPPAISAFAVAGPKTPPCEIRFVLSDAEGNQATVEFLYQVPGQGPEPMAHLQGLSGNPAMLATTSQGVAYAIPWDFPAEDLLPGDASFTDGVLVMAKVQGAPDVIVLGANAQQLGLGNDPPILDAQDPPPEVAGVVPVPLHMADSSSDPLDVRVEYDIQGDDPDLGWQLALPAGLPPGTPPPALAFVGIPSAPPPQGTDIVFFWDTDAQLPDLEHDVQLRVTPIDPVVAGAPALTGVFSVDNNAAPILQLSEGAFLSDPDSARGIHVPFVAIDEEGDEITVALQWRREDEAFPELPDTAAEVEAILADPALRREHHICSQYPRTFDGRAVPIDATHVRLPELSGALSFLVQEGLAGRQLELLRPPTGLAPVSDAWPLNPLVHPAAALPLDGGTHALVLDESPGGSWTLVRLRLADGELEDSVASGTGVPSAMGFARDEASVLVASSVGSTWQLTRVELANGSATFLADANVGPVEPGVVRGLASLGTGAALLTVGSSLVRVDWNTPAGPRALALRADLETPWGVVLDPRNAGWVLVAESGAAGALAPGRVVTVDLTTGTLRPVVILPSADDGLAFPRPRGIALLRKGTRLVAVCETDPFAGAVELRSVDLGRGDTSSAAPLGPPLSPGAAALAADAENDLLIATSGPERRVFVAGGVEGRASITAVDPGTAVVTLVEGELPPAVGRASRWRIELQDDGPLRVASSAEGLAHTFLWNSLDVPGGGAAYLRGTPLDTDIGTIASSTGPKLVSPSITSDPDKVTRNHNPRAFALADLDGDGDLDLVFTRTVTHELRLLWQTAPGTFELDPIALGGPGVTPKPASVLAADLDGDGDLDLASGNYASNTITIFWRDAAGGFGPVPTELIVPGPVVSISPILLTFQAADLEGDGDLDLVCANYGSHNLAVFWQKDDDPGVFETPPTLLGGPSTTSKVTFVRAADLDADGDLDLVSANSGNSTLTVFWQSPPGFFLPDPLVLDVTPANIGPISVEAADLDADGDLDLVSANGYGAHDLSVYWQTAPGTFELDPTPLGGPLVSPGSAFVQAADLDGDGDLDIFSANLVPATVTTFWQTTPGTFDPVPTIVGGQGVISGVEVRPADLDGDGDLDLVSANPGPPDNLAVFWQTAPGAFAPHPQMYKQAYAQLGLPQDLQLADLDGDGDLDLVTANAFFTPSSSGNDLKVFWQNDQRALEPVPTILGGGADTTSDPRSVATADLDGDGDLDVVSANYDSSNLTVFRQVEPRTFESTPTSLGGPASSVGRPASTDRPVCVQASDLDGDGKLDLICANQLGQDVTVFWQDKFNQGKFEPEPTRLGGPTSTSGPLFVQSGDLDGDGDLDLVSANHDGDDLTVFWQTAPRTFDANPTHVGGSLVMNGPACVRAVDLDGDGDLDLVSANELGDNLTVFWQLAPGDFDPSPVQLGNSSTTLDARSVQAADLDADGDLDLVVLNRQPTPDPSTLTVFWQTTPGRFSPDPTLIVVPGPTAPNGVSPLPVAVQAVDFDADGDPDLVFASTNLFYLAVCRKLE